MKTVHRPLSAAGRRFAVAPRLGAVSCLAAAALLLASGPASGQSISLTAVDQAYVQDFNTLALSGTSSVTPNGWTFAETGSNANTTYGTDNGSSNSGNTYSYGPLSNIDRAFGGLQSGSLVPIVGASFTNNTGVTLTDLRIAYIGEQWRLGATGRADRIDFQFSVDATSLTTGTWTDANALDFSSPSTTAPTGTRDGNAVRTALASTIGSLTIADGATFWIRWTDFNASGSDDGLAVDNFSLIANPSGSPTPPAGVGAASPSTIGTGGTTRLTVTAFPGTNPTSSNLMVTGDLSSIGGSSTQQFFDDGVSGGDINANDNTFTFQATVAGNTTPGLKTLPVTITDGENRQANTSISLTVQLPIPIHQIQGDGSNSPLADQIVTTTGIVTALRFNNGYFIQTPDAEADGDPNTSEGIFVFTSSAPTAVVGDAVQVTGTVSEFIPGADPFSPPLTELTGPAMHVVSNGNPLPAAMPITAADTQVNDLDNLERWEGMRVHVDSITVAGPTLGSLTESSATSVSNGVFYGVVTGVARPFREPGVQVPDTLPPGSPANVPRFDTNPERLRVDSDGQVGGTAANVTTGATVTNLTGVLDYGFRTYSILADPTPLSVTGNISAVPVRMPAAHEFTVGSFNMQRFYNDFNDPGGDVVLTTAAYNNRKNKASLAIRNVMRSPDILAVSEVENLATLQDLANKISADGGPTYSAHLVPGNDVGLINVGFLVKTSRVSVGTVTQVGGGATCAAGAPCFTNPNTGLPEIIWDRPPLVLEATVDPSGQALPVTVIANHFRSLNGIDDTDPDDCGGTPCGTEGARVRAKRNAGAEWLADYIQSRQTADPSERIVSVGDFNAFEFNDGFVDVMGALEGSPAPSDEVVLASSDLVNPDLTDLVELPSTPAAQRYSYVFDGSAQVLDHIVVNDDALVNVVELQHARNDADFPETFRNDPNRPERISDHDMPVAFFGLPALSIDNVSQAEGNTGDTLFNFTVTLSPPSDSEVTVSFASADGTATVADSDYDSTGTGGLTFAPGETSKTVTVTVHGDLKFEGNETFTVELSNASGALIADGSGLGTIQNDDPMPSLSIGDVNLAEGNSGTTSFDFEVALSTVSGAEVTVTYTTQDGTATTGDGDYQFATGTLTFAPGETSKTASVLVNGDTKLESDESFAVNLSNASGAAILDGTGSGGITNDDVQPTISIDNVTQAEGDSGTSTFTFTVSLSNASDQQVTVDFATADGTATDADNDYEPTSGTVTFAAGDTSETVTVTVNGDTKFEGNEDFTVGLANANGATIFDGTGLGTITNDDAQPAISIDNVTQAEGDSGTSTFTFTVSLSNASDQQVTVDFATADGTATDADNDYEPTSGTVTFVAGDTSETVTVTVNGDGKFEGDEAFTVGLANASGATIADDSGLGTITNDDAQPTISIDNVTQAEGDSGTSTFTFTVSLSNTSDQQVTVDFSTADGTATDADNDYEPATGTVTFAAGDTSETVTVTVNGDTKFEGDQTFTVGLSNASGATIADDTGLGTITNDDAQPTISIDDVTQAEGNSGPTSFTFTVSLSNASDQQITVDFATADGTATDADNDYEPASGTVTFAAGDTEETITVTVNGDLKFEDDETFTVGLVNPTGATIADDTGLGTITNDDVQPTISIGDVTQAEGDTGTTPFNFVVTLSNPSEETITVAFTTVDGTAVAPGDYATTSGTVTFNPGDTEETITVNVAADLVDEPTETFTVVLSTPTNATILDDTGLGTITNDDDPRITIDDVSELEGNSGTTPFVFTVTLDRISLEEVTVDFFTAGGSADEGVDYQGTSGTLTFAPGETSKTITVQVTGETLPEANEEFKVHLNQAVNAIIDDNKGDGTILNDDGPTISINDVSVAEGDSGTTNMVFTVTLSSPPAEQVRVDFITRDGTATVADNDYVATSGTVVFQVGDTSETITVVINGDTTPEPRETLFVDLSNAVRAVIGDGTGRGFILDEEGNQPPVAVDDTAITCHETPVNIDVLDNDTDPESDTLTITEVGTPSDGTAVIEGDGTITYTPGDGFTGTATFTYTISDGNGNTETATVTVTIEHVTPAALVVDGQAGSGSNGNGVLEPSETAPVAPAWTNSCSADPITLTGLASAWTGPADGAGSTYDLDDTTADYGTIAASATVNCQDATGDCYAMGATAATRPAFHWDGNFLETLSNDDTKTWIVHLGNSFTDVTTANGFYAFVETMLHLNVTSGCAINGDRLGYCPTASTTREQMSKFVLISKEGPSYTAPACNPSDPRIFADVSATNGFCPFIEELFRRTVVNGCALNPPRYCPQGIVTREQMAKFVLKTLDPLLNPPACVPGSEVFSDVPATNGFCPFIEELFDRGVVNGCGLNPPRYCPTDPVTREQMSKFLVLTFDLKLYQP